MICRRCDKICHLTIRGAREHIADILKNKKAIDRQLFAFKPYLCPYKKGVYHVGHDHNILMIDFSKKRVVNLERRISNVGRKPGTGEERLQQVS